MADYHKVGLLALREGRILLCRKRAGTQLLILPGGCLEPGESAEQCLARELAEELGAVGVEDLHYVGTYEDRAATADPAEHKTVRVELYRGQLVGTPRASAEIAELVWFGEEDDPARLAPSLSRTILPDLYRRGLLPWSEVE